MCRLNHLKAININRENDFRVGSVNQCQYGSRHYSEDQLFHRKQILLVNYRPVGLLKVIATARINNET